MYCLKTSSVKLNMTERNPFRYTQNDREKSLFVTHNDRKKPPLVTLTDRKKPLSVKLIMTERYHFLSQLSKFSIFISMYYTTSIYPFFSITLHVKKKLASFLFQYSSKNFAGSFLFQYLSKYFAGSFLFQYPSKNFAGSYLCQYPSKNFSVSFLFQ